MTRTSNIFAVTIWTSLTAYFVQSGHHKGHQNSRLVTLCVSAPAFSLANFTVYKQRAVLGLCSISSVQSLSTFPMDFVTPWTAAHQTSLSITDSRSVLKLMSIESVMPSNHLILCHLLLFPPSIFPSLRVFSNESVLHIRWPKYCSFSFSIRPSNEYLGLISFRIDRLDLLAVQGTLKSLVQHHSPKASILWISLQSKGLSKSSPTPQFKTINSSAFFTVQLSHPYTTAGKTIALTRHTVVGKVMSLLFNMLSRLIIAFFPRSKRLLISWLQSPSAVIWELKDIVCHCFLCFPISLP